MWFLIVAVSALLLWRLYLVRRSRMRARVALPFPEAWRQMLDRHVDFYHELDGPGKHRFEHRVRELLEDVRITGIGTPVSDKDRMLVAASGVIPIFGFPQWRYRNLDEVLLYPASFDHRYQTAGSGRTIMGQVGTGIMGRKMILSRPALEQGFANEHSKSHVGIHEFVHLIDMLDGAVDGTPEVLLEKQYTLPWLELMREKIAEIAAERSDINAYGGTAPAEFFPVVAEYFFKRPELLERKHPQLHALLERMFRQDPT